MATSDTVQYDPLNLLRQSIASGSPCLPSTTEDATTADSVDVSLAKATYLHFTSPVQLSLPLTTPTRFFSSEKPVDLRSIYFAYRERESAIPEYNASAAALNEELGGAGGEIHKLAFVERLDLITWLEGASEESEYIKPLAEEASAAAASAQVAAGTKGGIAPVASGAAGVRGGKGLDPRLVEIYNGERRMGDRNTVLRGIKPTDFSHVRKLAAPWKGKQASSTAGVAAAVTASSSGPTTSLPHNPKSRAQRPDPIILLSPSASSLLKMSNIKSFLESAMYVPADGSAATSTSSASILHIMRRVPSINGNNPIRFILVDTPEQFKPEYWDRVVAVFTTGQAWQFKNYKWQNPSELFRNTIGVYVGWKGEDLPDPIKGWGKRVLSVGIDKYVTGGSRWRDREGVEAIWSAVEAGMRAKGWSRDHGPLVASRSNH